MMDILVIHTLGNEDKFILFVGMHRNLVVTKSVYL